MVGDSFSVVKAEHFKTHRGPSSNSDEAAEHFGLQKVMVGVVMTLTEKKEISASQTGQETLAINESAGRDVPDTPGERVISTKS